MRVVLSGGGTGGHIYPALAIARHLKAESPETEIIYIGTKNGLESRLVPQAGITLKTIDIRGFKRSLSLANVNTVMRFLLEARSMKRWLRQWRPDAVIGTGGYVCGPVLYAASRLGLPTYIHEQNVIPGLTNRFLSRMVKQVWVSMPDGKHYFPKAKEVVYVGNPRASEVCRADAREGLRSLGLPPDTQLVVIVGGSRGARAINEAVLEAIPRLTQLKNWHFLYITGEIYYDEIKERLASHTCRNVTVVPFIHQMPEILAATKLIVNRAGASFLAEITALGIPSILIPSPNVTNDHQTANAKWIAAHGAGVYIPETELSSETLFRQIKALLDDREELERLGRGAKKLGKPDALDCIAECLRARKK